MGWIIFVAGAVLSWGAYGALLHLGQTQLGNPLKALLCVGRLFSIASSSRSSRSSQGNLSNFDSTGLDGDDCWRPRRSRGGLHHLGIPHRGLPGM